MLNRLKTLWNQRRSLIITAAAVLLITAAVVVAAVLITNRPTPKQMAAPAEAVAFTKDSVNYVWERPTQDPTADPTRPPEAVMADLIGDWRQTGENPSGMIELHLHGDNTAVYVVKGVFDEEPRSVNTRWQAQDGLLSLVTDGGEVTQLTLEMENGAMVLSGSYGSKITYEAYTPEAAADENK